ncbi:YjdF family protein [Christensenellaceae bacterium OttesenSCG-928-L17]|nr:YjdF family protein [Christensenellaceae bacterium OttesenSCG-928-L17]
MQKTESKLTVFFDDPFWVGVYERISDGKLEVCKITFGAEPKDYEVYEFLLQNWNKLRFSPPIKADNKSVGNINPKRMQRAIKKQLEKQGVGTKAQQAMKLQQAEGKEARKRKSRLQREQEKERQFEIKQEKRREKHKGH